METRKLGDTDLELTTVGLGTWAMGGPWEFGWGPQDDDQAVAAILRALELGINWIDTAPAYGLGHSEELLSKALTQTSAEPIIATKCGILWDDEGHKISCLKRESVMKECEDSLGRLDIDVIDLYQMHWPVPNEDFEEAWEAMLKCRDQGKVRYVGVSNFNVEQLEAVTRMEKPVSLQPPYSMIHREAEDELLAWCADNALGVVVYSPMQRGLLTGKFSHEHLKTLAPDDHRLKNGDFKDPSFSATLELVEKLKPIAEQNGKTLAQLAVAWTLRRNELTAAIVGARKPEQIEETAGASGWKLTDDETALIETLLAERTAKLTV